MALPLRVRVAAAAVNAATGSITTMSPRKRALLQQHPGPPWVGYLVNGWPDRAAAWWDTTIPGPAGDIPVRLYRPRVRRTGTPVPLLVCFHGGGFVFGHVSLTAWLASRLSARLGAVVVAPGYRLAPQHPAPAAREDSWAALEWTVQHAAALGADPGRLAVLGDSAGALLAVVMCLMARERGLGIRAQGVLQTPLDLRPSAPALNARENVGFGRATDVPAMVAMYLGEEGDPNDPMISPLLAADFSGLPPAFVLTAEHDYARLDAYRYADELRKAGVRLELADFPDSPHGIFDFPVVCGAAGPALEQLTDFLRRELG